ncbi:asparagine synthase (glutamine-hydrolyzing) [Oscillochloris sp. ZM17-4]|uniref:asparagine synthase (glutamine-hydrolyzing) n=1 Tax=Oscillochloris sp. ZM17-4 TaxID=2866714 RepID=UPI001C731E30|nr:asparagine synthase (glutamine-hydrolyzing) [Oscillochloris sp. ZM17-4]MBX0331030.1 asparagine synthase (glutamine-hydrolyzing) [Oscillochloris sp. ZM17-4]
MCGICGILHSDGRPVDADLLRRMNDSITHRGPDSDGFFLAGHVGMAMRRLAIIDLSGGDQPIFNEDGSVAITFNGEIYNYRELRAELLRHGHRFATDGDTEVIVHAYEQWGDAMLPRLNGMFAFAIWDAPRRRLLIARDRMGEKPLYWQHSPTHGLVWGSEAKAVLAAPWVERRVNPLALHHYLTLQYTPDPLTIYAGVSQLPAAHKLVLEGGAPPRVERWWQLPFEPKLKISDGEAIAQARALLGAAVERQLVSEVPLGAFLSGGIDSSIIVALMAERASERVRTFSIGFDERHFSETHYARQVAERYGTEHHEFIFRPADLVRVIEGVAAAVDEPFADPAALPLYELARQTRRHVTVALSGDGGDETLAGYRRYMLDGWLRPYAALPGWITQGAVPAAAARIPEPTWIPEDRNPITGFKRLGQFSAVTHKASLVRWGSYFSQAEKLALYTDRWRDELARVDSADWLAAAYDGARASSLLDRTLSADHATYLAGDLLPKTDRMSMAHSLEARAPFLDAAWVEWTARLPARLKVRGRRTKWLLAAAFGEMLPPEVAARGKQGFSIPVGTWLRNELRPWAEERLLDSPALGEWLRPAAVAALVGEHMSGKVNHGKKLWALLMLELWMEQKMGTLV